MAVNPFELATTPLHIDAMELDSFGDGVPPYLVGGVATEVVRLLVANGIDPSAAYFRGRGAEPENLADVARQIEIENRPGTWLGPDDRDPDDDYADRQDPYDDILGEAEARRIAQEEALGRQIDGAPTPVYSLGMIDALFSDDTLSNPIHLAGVTDESSIDVYDKAMVDSLDPGQEEASLTKIISIPDEQLALAALARVRLNYVIVGEDA
jgi:hypothetical protein